MSGETTNGKSTIKSISLQLEDGKILTMNEKEIIIQDAGDEYKVGYDDAIVMNKALRTIMADVYKERKELRKTADKNTVVVKVKCPLQ